jgi:Peptidase family M28
LVLGFQLCAQVRFDVVSSANVKTRLDAYKGNDKVREEALLKLFGDAGCSAPNLSEQKVRGRKEPNVICTLPGETSDVILIGAHFDHASEGSGIVDNRSGASILPSLFQSLAGSKHKHTFVFVGFTGEESGEIGSRF